MESKGSGLTANSRNPDWKDTSQPGENGVAKPLNNALHLMIEALAGPAADRDNAEVDLLEACGQLLERFVPTGMLLDREGHVVQTFAGAERYLPPSRDDWTTDIRMLVEGELKEALTEGIARVGLVHTPVSFRDVRATTSRGEAELTVTVIPLGEPPPERPLLFITFEDRSPSPEDLICGVDESAVRTRMLALEDAVHQRDQFLTELSHELRNPLGALVNATQVLDRHCQTSQICQSPCAVIQRQSQQMARLLDDLQDVSRVVQGKTSIQRVPFDLRKAIELALEVVRPQFTDRAHKLHLAIDPLPLWIHGDCSRVRQILVNLLVNATKYTPNGGEIWVSARRESGRIVLRVRDTGNGIPPNMLDQIFELFVQADPVQDGPEHGMGVGLALVKKFVDLHQGEVTAHSDGLGRGSEFVVRFPACADRQLEERPTVCEPAAACHGRVLVVEDDDDSREMLGALLTLDGYAVGLAADGFQALAALDDDQYDIAIVDIGLPELDGYEVARRIRLDARHAGMQLVALTGYGQSADRSAVKAAGFDAHLVKPLDQEALAKVLQQRA